MAIAHVVDGATVNGANGGTTTASDDTGADLNVFGVGFDSGATATCTDNKGNTPAGLTVQTGPFEKVRIFYTKSPIVGPGHTATLGPGSVFGALAWGAFSGLDLTAPFDVENGANLSGGAASVLAAGSVTPSNANSLSIVALTLGVSGRTVTFPTGYTEINHVAFVGGTSNAIYLGYRILTSGAENPQWSWTGGATTGAAAVIAIFNPAGGGGASPLRNFYPGPNASSLYGNNL